MKNYPPYFITVILITAIFVVSCNEEKYVPVTYGSVQGVVMKDWNEEPVSGARITTSPTLTPVNTDSLGQFIFEEIETGEYTFTASKDGYNNKTERVNIEDEENPLVKIYISEEENVDFGKEAIVPDSPVENATGLPIKIDFEWSYKKSNYRGTPLTTNLYVIDAETLEEKLIAENVSDSIYTATGFRFNATYLWYLSVKADEKVLGKSDILRFKTQTIPKDLLVYCKDINDSYEIMAYDSVNGYTYQLTNHPAKDWYPRKAPFGDLIAFISTRDNENHIYTMLPDGTNLKRITQIPVAGYNNNGIGFAWSPDAGYLIYPNNDKLIKINKDGYDAQVLATAPAGRHFGQCDWSRYGGKIVVQTVGPNIYESEIYLMNEDGSDMRMLVGDLPGRTESPCISIDGKEVYFTNDISGLNAWDGTQLDSRLFKLPVDSTDFVQMDFTKENGENLYYPKVMHDGFGLVLSVGTGSSGKRKIYQARFSEEGGTGLDVTDIISGDMPDW